MEIQFSHLQDRDATVVKVRYVGEGPVLWSMSATGSAKRKPGDRHVPDVGVVLATVRALRGLADGMERQLWGVERTVKERVPGRMLSLLQAMQTESSHWPPSAIDWWAYSPLSLKGTLKGKSR